MPRLARLSTCSALALSMASTPALADLTAQQVWDGMEAAMLGFGYTVNATETPVSGGLNVTDVTMNVAIPEDDGAVSIGIDRIALVENSDGSVGMTFPPSMPITVDAAPTGEDAFNMVLDYTNTGFEVVVSGTDSDLSYTYGADQLAITLTDLVVNDESIGRDEARFAFTMDGFAGTARTVAGTGTQITQDAQIDSARYDMAFNDPESDDAALVTGSMQAIRLESSSDLPEGFDPADPASLVSGGFSATGKVTYENGAMQFAATESGAATSGTTRSGTVALNFAIDDAQMQYDVSATDQAISLSGPELPMPVNLSMAKSAFNMTVPVAQSETPQDMAFGLTFGGFEMSDALWNLADPGAVLPRDPATIALNLTGQVTPFVNMLDPSAMAQLEATGGAPGELNALTLHDLTVEAAGAKLGGSGSFTFDNDDVQTFDGFPRPTGSVDLTLDGANGLIDKLITMGLLTNEDAMGARMMISMFAVPGSGPDSLNSSIQINDQGHVLANGMRIQ